MKRRYNDGGKLPPAEEAVRTAVLEPVEPAPMSEKKRTEKLIVGKASDLTPAERRKMVRDMKMAADPVPKAKGGYVKAADGCAVRGKTRGKMV